VRSVVMIVVLMEYCGWLVVVIVVVVVRVLIVMGAVVLVAAHAPARSEVWWCRGAWSSACSAWKIASDTSWRACSLASR
jgi:hypothetical protein